MKKMIAFSLAMILLCCSLSFNVCANSTPNGDFGDSSNMFDDFNANLDFYKSQYVSAAQIEESLQNLTEMEETKMSNNARGVLVDTYFANTPKEDRVKNGRFIECVLNLNDGITDSELWKAYNISDDASTEAASLYSEGSLNGPQDAYRHFCWNFKMARELKTDRAESKLKARAIACNHEWGNRFSNDERTNGLNNIYSYFNSRVINYTATGNTEEAAIDMAYDDAVAYIPFVKNNYVFSFTTFAKFQELWHLNEFYMDFHNNCYGRAYGEGDAYITAHQAYAVALANNEIILSDSDTDTTYDRKWCVWGWNWYA